MKFLPITTELATTQRIAGSDFLRELCASILHMYVTSESVLPWIGYLTEKDGELIGTCAFKTPPESGSVEIAYFTFPGYEGRGIATAMARHLVELAALHGVRHVRAQTLPEKNASNRLLEKLGFTLSGSVMHPDDGEVWEWRRAL